jgi:serine/threonine protein kinase
MTKAFMKEIDVQDFENEVEILYKLQKGGVHPGVIKMYHYYEDPKRYLLIQDICNGGNLAENFKKRKLEEDPFTEDQVATIIKQILSGLRFMHKLNIVHRDIRLENILL